MHSKCRKQADFVLFLSSRGSRFSSVSTFRTCTDLQNKHVFPDAVFKVFPSFFVCGWLQSKIVQRQIMKKSDYVEIMTLGFREFCSLLSKS